MSLEGEMCVAWLEVREEEEEEAKSERGDDGQTADVSLPNRINPTILY